MLSVSGSGSREATVALVVAKMISEESKFTVKVAGGAIWSAPRPFLRMLLTNSLSFASTAAKSRNTSRNER